MNTSLLTVFCIAVVSLLGCDFDYRSSVACSTAGECFRNEVCEFDEEGVGQCRLAQAIVPNVERMSDGQVTPESEQELMDMVIMTDQAAKDMFPMQVVADLGDTMTDMGLSADASDGGQTTANTVVEQAADIVCPSADTLNAVRFECAYPETEERRDYCQYFVSEVGTRQSCQTFCESIGLFSCDTTADCCWNNRNESNCTTQEQDAQFTCAGEYDSVICRCFESAP